MSDVRAIDPVTDSRWDALVERHPHATVYHLAAWSTILSRAYRFSPCHLAVEGEDGELLGVLPLMRKHGPVSGRRMRSLPAIEIGGPLAAGEAVERALLVAACERAHAGGFSMLMDSTRAGLDRGVEDLVEVSRPPTWVAQVPDGTGHVDDWLRARSSNLRRGVKRARSRGVAVRLSEAEVDLRAFYRLYLSTMRKHRSLPRSWRQLDLERRLLGPERFKLFVAEADGAAVAAGVFHCFGDTLELLYNGSDDRALDLRPNHALYAEAVRWATANGVGRLDYGYAWPRTPLAGFKQQWGAEEEARHRYALAARPSSGNAAAGGTPGPGARSRTTALAEAGWGRAPLALTRAAGALAYRYL